MNYNFKFQTYVCVFEIWPMLLAALDPNALFSDERNSPIQNLDICETLLFEHQKIKIKITSAMNLRLYTLQHIKTKPYLDVYDGT